MPRTPRSLRGFSLIELLVVLTIIGILSLAGVMAIGNKTSGATRTVMDQLEGALQSARQNAVVASIDIPLVASGTWMGTTPTTRLTLDGRQYTGAYPATATDTVTRIGSPSEQFISLFTSSRDHQHAGVATDPTWVTAAMATLKALPPCQDEPFLSALGNPLFNSDGSANLVRINGTTKRFETGFYIPVVGLSGAYPSSGGAVGFIVVPANSTSVYRFYRPAGTTTWGRI